MHVRAPSAHLGPPTGSCWAASLHRFVTNSNKAVYTHNTFKAGLTDFVDRAPLESLGREQLRKYRTVRAVRALLPPGNFLGGGLAGIGLRGP